MAMTQTHPADLVDVANARQSRRIFWDPEVYEAELEHVFARCWLFLTHESLIPEPGDFTAARMGEDSVLVVRQTDGSIRAFLNACTHRGNVVCKAERGRAKAFTCSYHGWAFGLDGSLENVPLERLSYRGRIDKAALGLVPVAQVASHKGFVFGTFDPDAPPLEEYLGEFAWYWDSYLDALPGGTECLAGPMKYRLPCNWKLPAENFAGDGYHVGWTHVAAVQALSRDAVVGGMGGNPDEEAQNRVASDEGGFEMTARYGHGAIVLTDGFSGAALHEDPGAFIGLVERSRPDVAARLGEWRARFWGSHCDFTAFPNFSGLPGSVFTYRVWHPAGPRESEIWIWCIVPTGFPDELKEQMRRVHMKTFGTAGLFEVDDADPLVGATRANRGFITRNEWLWNGMRMGAATTREDLPGLVQPSGVAEVAQRGFYRNWAELMRGLPWDEVGRRYTEVG